MSVRYHFANCTDPLKEGVDLVAACGEVVERAKFAMWVDQEVVSVADLRKAIGLCRHCRVAELEHRLVYIVSTGKEAVAEVEA